LPAPDRKRAAELHVLHPHADVEGSIQVAPGLYRWGDVAHMAELCADPKHPAKPEDFHFLRGCMRWSLQRLKGEVEQGRMAAIPASAVDPLSLIAEAGSSAPYHAWRQVCKAHAVVSAWSSFPNYRDSGVADAVTRYKSVISDDDVSDSYDGLSSAAA